MLSLKTGVENNVSWSEIGSGFGEPVHHEFPEVSPREGIQYILKSTSVINYDA